MCLWCAACGWVAVGLLDLVGVTVLAGTDHGVAGGAVDIHEVEPGHRC